VKHSRVRKLNTNELSRFKPFNDLGGNRLELLGYSLDLDSGEIRDQLKKDTVSCDKDAETLLVLLAHYAAAEPAEITGKLVKFRDLPGGYAYEEAFNKRVIQPLATVFENKPEGLVQAAKLLKGIALNYGDSSVQIPFLEVHVVCILWKTEEFPASATVLFEESASRVLPTEDLAVLAELITIRLERSWNTVMQKTPNNTR